MRLPEAFTERMKERLGEEFPAFLQSYEAPPYKGLRVNTLKLSAEEFARRSPFPLGERVPWEENAFYVSEEKAGGYAEHFAGLYYLQEPSAMCVGDIVRDCPKGRVLDLCAAPGGKTTHLAAQMKGEGILISNEYDGGRARILSQNAERMGIVNCAVTNSAPQQLAAALPAYFSLVLVDAPCSGEGMFKKEPEALAHWSLNNVALCAARQREILEEGAKAVASGGYLAYSTCTFAREEDEEQVAAFLLRHPEFVLEREEKIYPHTGGGEGHYCALLKKISGEARGAKPYPVRRNAQANRAFAEFAADFFTLPPAGEITTLADGRMYLVPAGMPALGVHILRLGLELGEFDGKIFKPAHALAMSGKRADFKRYLPLDQKTAERYLRGETIESDLENGWCVAGLGDYPLGLGKASGGVVKNHLPKGLRRAR